MKVGDAEGVCVRGGKTCTSCTPSQNRRCDWNFSTSETDRARSTTELELPTRPTQQFKWHAINGMGRANTEKWLPPSNGIYGTRNPVYLTNPNLSLNPKSKPTSSPILFPSCYFIFRSADGVSRVSQDLLYVCVSGVSCVSCVSQAYTLYCFRFLQWSSHSNMYGCLCMFLQCQ